MAELAPWLFMAGDSVVVNKDSTLMASYAFAGMDDEGMSAPTLNDLVRRVGSALRGWDDRPVHLWWTLRRRRILDYPEATFPDPVSARVDDNRRRAFIEGRQFRNTHFLSPCLMPERAGTRLGERVRTAMHEGQGFLSAVWNALRLTFDPSVAFAYSANELDTQVERFEALLTDFTEPLRDLFLTRLTGSELTTFLHGQVSPVHDRQANVVTPGMAEGYPDWFLDAGLPDAEMRVFEDCLQFEGDQKQFVAAITIVAWREGAERPELHPGFLDALARLPVELTVSHIFRLMPRAEAHDHIERVRWYNGMAKWTFKSVLNSAARGGDTSGIPTNKARADDEKQADEAFTALNSGKRQFGWHNTTVLVFGDTPEALEESLGIVTAALRYQGVVLVRERLHLVSAFAGTLPGQHAQVRRWRVLSSLAQACVAPLFSIRQGDPVSRHLTAQTGRHCPALAVMPTAHGMPFYFDPFVGDVGHGLILGPTGAGKTIIVSFLMAQWRKYHPARIVIFDKDFSCKVQTLLMGGRHVVPSSGMSSGVKVNPLAWLSDPAEWGWIARWVEMLVASRGTYKVTAEDERLLHEAVEATASLPREDWRLLSLASGLPSRLREELSPWIGDGPQAPFFDNVEDGLDLADLTCIEMGEVFLYPHVARAFLDYAFHRLVRTIMEPGPDGRPVPTLVYLEECQHLLSDPAFEAKVKDWLETFRKKLTAVWMTTQSPESVLTSRIWPAVRDNVRTRVLLPNPEARSDTLRKLFTSHLSLNEVQIEAIATSTGKGQLMVVQPGLSRMVNLRLDADTLACLRSDKAALGIFDRIYREGGEGWQARYIEEVKRHA